MKHEGIVMLTWPAQDRPSANDPKRSYSGIVTLTPQHLLFGVNFGLTG